MENILIIQARMSSTRLPGKVMLPIGGRPMISYQIERVKRSTRVDRLIVATSTDVTDDVLSEYCENLGVDVYRGSLNDVLDRYYMAACIYEPSNVIRLTADCPLIDSTVINYVLDIHLSSGCDYTSNTLRPTYPDGMDVEVMRMSVLETMWREARKKSHREHVTLYAKENPDRFSLNNIERAEDISHLRLTVDEPSDFEVVNELFGLLYAQNKNFQLEDILTALEDHPHLTEINSSIDRDEGLKRSRYMDALSTNLNLEKSLALQERAERIIPGMSQLLSKRPDQFSKGVWPGYYCQARGVTVTDIDGNSYVDMSIGGIGATVLGYADSDIDQAVKKAIDKGVASSLNCPEEVMLAEKLCELHPWSDMVRYARTGGEAMAIAVRIARAFKKKDKIAFCGYHGWHDWYLASNLVSSENLTEHLLPGLSPDGVPAALEGSIVPFEYNNAEMLESILDDGKGEYSAIVMEPVRNILPAPGFLEKVRQIADKYECTLVFDEISSGFRLVTGGAHIHYGVEPDIAVFSKALGNGYAIAAVLGRKEVMLPSRNLFISSTCWSESVGPAAALAVIDKFQTNNVAEHLVSCGIKIQNAWKKLGEKYDLPIRVYGLPPISGFAFDSDEFPSLKALFVQLMQAQGYLATNAFYAMYAHTDEHIDGYIQAADAAFLAIRDCITGGNVQAVLKGKASVAGFKRMT